MQIRDATVEDADAACLVMRRSIAELCIADHGKDEAILTRWLGNKTPEIFAVLDCAARQFGPRRDRGRRHPGGGRCHRHRHHHAQLRLTGCAVSRDQPRLARCARSPRRGTGQHAMHPHQHRDRPALLSGQWLCRGWPAGRKFRNGFRLSDVQSAGVARTRSCMTRAHRARESRRGRPVEPGDEDDLGLNWPCRCAACLFARADRRADCGRICRPRATGFPPSRSGRWKR